MREKNLPDELRAVADAMLVARAKLVRIAYLQDEDGVTLLAGRPAFRVVQVELLPVASALVELASLLEGGG